ncbi:FecR family protein [Luteibacter jiangsuensis]
MNNRKRLTEEAADWYLTLRDAADDAPTHERFAAWLRRSPQHVAEYLAIAQLHGDLRAATAMDATARDALRELAANEPSVVPLHAASERRELPASRRGGRRTALRVGAIAATVVLAASVAFLAAWPGTKAPPVRYTADGGDIRTVTLPDDTRLQLAPGSAVDVAFDDRSRRIALLKGNASFDIGKDERRPMTVEAGNQRIEDIGTVFNVSRGADAMEVSVVNGHVAVFDAALPWLDRARLRLAGDGSRPRRIVELACGDSATISPDGKLVSRGHVEATTAAWLPEELRFHDETVAEVARRFNAYTPRPLTIEDPKLAAKRISGVFHAQDAAAFVSYLGSLPGVAVIHDAEHIRFVAARDGKRL